MISCIPTMMENMNIGGSERTMSSSLNHFADSSHYHQICTPIVGKVQNDNNYNATLVKRKQLQMERDLLDAQLSHLEKLEQARRCHNRNMMLLVSSTPSNAAVAAAAGDSAKERRRSRHNNDSLIHRKTTSNVSSLSSSEPTTATITTKSGGGGGGDLSNSFNSSSSSTMELTLATTNSSSHDHHHSNNDDDKEKDFHNSDECFELSLSYMDVLDKEITIDDSRSFCSSITLPLSAQEELDNFMRNEFPFQHQQQQRDQQMVEASPEVAPRSKKHRKCRSQQRPQPPQRSQHESEGTLQRHRLQRRADSDSDPDAAAAVQPGRARHMPWLVALDDGQRPLKALYSGPLVKGLPYGIGTLRMKNGDLYMGEVVWGAMHGMGTYWNQQEGRLLRGQFVNNVYIIMEALTCIDDNNDNNEKEAIIVVSKDKTTECDKSNKNQNKEDKHIKSSSSSSLSSLDVKKCRKAIRRMKKLIHRLTEV